jgi:hypothetical protein
MAKAKGANTSGVTKTKMVEEAMDALGDPGPKEIQEYVRQKYGEELKYTMAASYKSQINKKRGGGGKRGGGTAGPSGPVDLKDVAAVKALYDRLGAAKLNDILKLFK